MKKKRVVTAAEMELMTPDERAQIVREGELNSLDDLEPAFRERVEAKSRRIVENYGLRNTESS